MGSGCAGLAVTTSQAQAQAQAQELGLACPSYCEIPSASGQSRSFMRKNFTGLAHVNTGRRQRARVIANGVRSN